MGLFSAVAPFRKRPEAPVPDRNTVRLLCRRQSPRGAGGLGEFSYYAPPRWLPWRTTCT